MLSILLGAALQLSPVSVETNGDWVVRCTVPRTARAKVLIPHSVGRVTSPDWTKLAPGATYERCNPGWGMTYRMVAVLNESGESYALIQKGAREHFSFLRVRQGLKDGEVILESGYVPDADDLKSGTVALPFGTQLVPFTGGWFAAAEKYREVVADEPWLKAARSRDFSRMRDIGFWFWNRLDSGTVIPPIERFMRDSGVPAALDWYWWHRISYDTSYPNYWPPREPLDRFAAAVKRLNEKGIFCQTYMNGMCWDVDDPSWTEGGEAGVRRRRDGSFPSTAWNRFTNHRLADMCGEAPEFQCRIRTLVKKLRALGFDGQYLDCIGNGGYGACWATNHVHAAGGGAHMVRDFRTFVSEVRRENPGMALCTEDINESYLDLFTSYIITSTSYERFEAGKAVDYEQVPVFMAVYHGAGVFFGNFATLGGIPAWDPQWPSAERWTEEKDWPQLFPDQFPVEVARGVVWGLQPTAHNFRMENITDPSCQDGYRFMIDTARFYHAHREWLFDGEMCDPGRLDCARAEVKFLNRGTYTKKGEYRVSTHELPTVFHSVWKSPKGEVGAVLANWSAVPRAYRLQTPSGADSATLPPRSWRFVRLGASGAAKP